MDETASLDLCMHTETLLQMSFLRHHLSVIKACGKVDRTVPEGVRGNKMSKQLKYSIKNKKKQMACVHI